ncbi:hypothetical protein BOTBODRAFT_38963 [Botryobasidium botryosum FD-172 SS1]|uniref:CENP-C homolog n=1 Tax=Botryobasidium botryosum (strain FD-172 SS1) TaxID=930990 RepID=A0A067LVA1_BOTB1|nr:hypothetical protein BOTBODRAFT_38963 [Botryobasidium botryosum FD-172 SS1]
MSQTSQSPPNLARRRGPPKPHHQFRDGLDRGRRTGKPIAQFPKDDEGFEDFDKYFDGDSYYNEDASSTNGHVRKKKAIDPKIRAKRTPLRFEGIDVDGEMSMDLDTSDPNSPRKYLETVSLPAPTSSSNVGSLSRPVTRGSDIDYDAIPSPRPNKSARSNMQSRYERDRDSMPPPKKATIRRPTTPRASSPPRNESDDDGDDDGGGTGFDIGDDTGGYVDDDAGGEESFAPEGNEDAEEERDSPPRSLSADKGKGKATAPEEESMLEEVPSEEDEIAQGMEELEAEHFSDEEPAAGPSKKKSRKSLSPSLPPQEPDSEDPEPPPPPPPKRQPRKKKEKVVIQRAESVESNADGLRRSSRRKWMPLEWWRGEKVVYSRDPSAGPSLVPLIKDVVHVPKDDPKPLGIAGKKRRRGTSAAPGKKAQGEYDPTPPEAGWDDKTVEQGSVLEYETRAEVKRRIACTAAMVAPNKTFNADFAFQKIFGDEDYIAAGVLTIPVGGEKPSKATKDNTYIFYCIEGAVRVQIHRTSFVIAPGGMFMVPRGNQYFIQNISEREVKLFFAQGRKLPMDEASYRGGTPSFARQSAPPRSLAHLRGSARPSLPPRGSEGASSVAPSPLSKQILPARAASTAAKGKSKG